MDFSYPPEVEAFRKELREWLDANLTDDVVAAARGRDRTGAGFDTLRAWDAKVADAGWAAVSWPETKSSGRHGTKYWQSIRRQAPKPGRQLVCHRSPVVPTWLHRRDD